MALEEWEEQEILEGAQQWFENSLPKPNECDPNAPIDIDFLDWPRFEKTWDKWGYVKNIKLGLVSMVQLGGMAEDETYEEVWEQIERDIAHEEERLEDEETKRGIEQGTKEWLQEKRQAAEKLREEQEAYAEQWFREHASLREFAYRLIRALER